nr:hypothetical protein [Tanacetum cinerariifolium]
MIGMCDGTSKDNGSKEEGMQGVKMVKQGNEQETPESIHTKIDENGVEVVVFDDVVVPEGSKRWDLTLCGFFVGYRISVNELRYNLRMMWSKFGFKDILSSIDLNLDNTKLERIPLWVKLCNVPLEAWTVKGISALASILGKPLVMDFTIANKCKQGIGMVRYARVLIKVNAKKILANDVEIVYKNAKGMVQCRKTVKVKYDWKPLMCSECGVFGHTYSRCYKNAANINTKTELEKENVKRKVNAVNIDQFKSNVHKDKSGGQKDDNDEGFVEVKRKNIGIENKVKRQNFKANPQVSKVGNNSKTVYQAKTMEFKSPSKTSNKTHEKEVGNGLSTSNKQDDIVKLIQEEKLQICVVLETHLKNKRIGVVHIARQSVLVKVESRDGNLRLYGTFIYASNSGLDLEIYKIIVGNEPWFLSGDFNVTPTPKEHSIGSSAMSSDMKDFQRRVNTIQVEDINSFGLSYTWTKNLYKTNNGGQTEILKKLDKIMGNEDLSNRMFKTVKNLKGLKKHLKQLAWCNGNVFENVKKLREAVKDVQKKTDKDLNNHDLRSEEANVLKLYSEAMNDEDKILYHKEKVKWLSVGDRNNACFHKTIKSRQQRNRIDVVCDENGSRFKGNDVTEQFIKHFQQFLGESRHVEPISDMDSCKLSSVEAYYMVREVSNEEIKASMFQIDDNKALGPDGYSATFFKKAWIVADNDVCLAVKEFFETWKILREINSTLIAPVPKIQTPLKVSDFRPIACCNVIYKCISKVLIKRLKGCLDKLVRPKIVVVKVDIQKAYDTVNWQFLESILNGFGLHPKMVQWIMRCVSTTSFLIYINGQRFGYFKGEKGLKHGDPISPYIFTLVMEILTLIIKRKSSLKVLKESIDEFGKVAWLILNYNKSTIIFGSLDDEKKDLLEVMPFKVEKLPIRKQSFKLEEQMPIICRKANQNDRTKERAKVAWKNVCKFKQNRGLGLKDLKVWNKAIIVRHLCHIVNDKESLWVKWINTEKLRGRSV